MKLNFLLLAAAILPVACGGPVGKAQTADAEAKTRSEAVPEYRVLDHAQVDLTAFPKDKEGFYVIFDGRTLNGWRGYGKEHVPPKWRADDGAIRYDPAAEGEGGDLIFAHRFRNFEFETEWMISERGNSGILYLGREVVTTKEGRQELVPFYFSSPEYQVFDNVSFPDADAKYLSASLYDLIPAVPQNARPHGEWNRAKIRVHDGKVIHFQNDRSVVEYHLRTPQWTAMLEASKFGPGDRPLAFELLRDCGGAERAGYIGFQDHGDDVRYRNIRIRVLE